MEKSTAVSTTAKPDTSGAIAFYDQATNVAGLCRDLALRKALSIGNRRFLPVEVWTTIAVVHGFIATIKENSVQDVYREGKLQGVRAIAQLKRQSDGAILSEAEGFVGDDEVDWYGSHGQLVPRWNKKLNREEQKIVEKRADYAIRAMAQTRAVSRVCRTAFSHVVVMIDEKLSTVPYEEMANDADVLDVQTVPEKADAKASPAPAPTPATPQSAPTATAKPIEVPRDEGLKLKDQFTDGKWRKVRIHFGKNGPKDHPPSGLALDELETNQLRWYVEEWQPKPFGNPPKISADDLMLRAALDAALDEEFSK
jgi:hypothetical protein